MGRTSGYDARIRPNFKGELTGMSTCRSSSAGLGVTQRAAQFAEQSEQPSSTNHSQMGQKARDTAGEGVFPLLFICILCFYVDPQP